MLGRMEAGAAPLFLSSYSQCIVLFPFGHVAVELFHLFGRGTGCTPSNPTAVAEISHSDEKPGHRCPALPRTVSFVT